MELKLVVLPGDGIGTEVTAAALQVLQVVAERFGHQLVLDEQLIGGIAMDERGSSLPDETKVACMSADAVLLGAVGGPKWDDPNAPDRPEKGLLGIRKAMQLYANLRPVQIFPELRDASPLKTEKLEGVDILVIRELTGGLYFGESGRWVENGETFAKNTMIYSESEIRRVVDFAFKAAQGRRKKVTSIDKANVLEVMRLWRSIANEVAQNYPDVQLEHMLVDAATMHLLSRPNSFDVMVAENMFGDIITDEASMLAGSMGCLPSASIGAHLNRHGFPQGLYEPIHGSAPDIAGKGIANPIATILSVAMMLRHSFGLEAEAEAIEAAVSRTIQQGYRTGDIYGVGTQQVGTQAMTEAIIAQF